MLDPEIDLKVMKLVNILNYTQIVKKIQLPKKLLKIESKEKIVNF